ncbi:hypothetical protein LJC59_06640 [Desulfovibrio sp. OttesenSCG-928-A18]|nr:hypothetical protein [Desulfovibrio sp. OttesenSCG-928-A18]
MAQFEELEALVGSIELPIKIPETRFHKSRWDAPYLPEPYTSLFEDVRISQRILLRNNKIRQNAMHPVYLQAGQAPLPNGELGRPAARHPVLIPELAGGRLLYTNI